MRRRAFITLLGGAAAWPLAARAQQAGKVHRIGFLGSATAAGSAKAVESLQTGLREFGYVEGTNIGIEFRWAEGIYDRLPHLVAELIATNVDVLNLVDAGWLRPHKAHAFVYVLEGSVVMQLKGGADTFRLLVKSFQRVNGPRSHQAMKAWF